MNIRVEWVIMYLVSVNPSSKVFDRISGKAWVAVQASCAASSMALKAFMFLEVLAQLK